ncbi:MAG: nucleoside triphosphate pyrophosphatase [Bdellovibrionota bacterium]
MLALNLGIDLILASGSPRRQKMLSDLGLKFSVQSANIKEERKKAESPADFVSRLAQEKAQKVAIEFPTSWIVAADTDVALDDQILGKPADEDEAYQMLASYSGRSHSVWSAFALICENSGQHSVQVSETIVNFTEIPDQAILAYIKTGEPMDKAGAYGIQGLANQFIKEIHGNFDNVVGLDLSKLVSQLFKFDLVRYV